MNDLYDSNIIICTIYTHAFREVIFAHSAALGDIRRLDHLVDVHAVVLVAVGDD